MHQPTQRTVAAAAAKSLQSCPTLATPWTAAYQAPLSMGFSRQEYWSGVPLKIPNKRNTKRPTWRNIITKLSKVRAKKRLLKIARKK